jgi:hypothetical protein
VVDGRLSAERLTLLVVLLDAGTLIVDVQRGNYSIGNYACAKATWSGFGHPTVEDQLYLFGPANIQIFPNHILEENPSANWPIQDLRQGQFDL